MESGLSCRAYEGLTSLIRPGAALLVGEMHGTIESPEFVGAVACAAIERRLGVTVALEVPREERARVVTFLGSSGTANDRAALLAGPFWQAEYQDGRRSQAMLALFDHLRRLRGSGSLEVALIDRAESPATSQARDRWMAEALMAALAERRHGFVVSLTGNVHSRLERGVPWDPDFEPAGFIVRSAQPLLDLVSLDVSYARGSAWICRSAEAASCGVREFGGRGAEQGGRVVLFPAVRDGYGGVYEVGAVSASLPAKSLTAPRD